MFRGCYFHIMDDKGRISVPPRYREILNARQEKNLIVTTFKGYLLAYPLYEWELLEGDLRSKPQFDLEHRRFQRSLVTRVSECTLDRQGRILIPAGLRDAARLEREVVIGGALNCFEIWSRPAWEEEMAQIERMDAEGSQKTPGT